MGSGGRNKKLSKKDQRSRAQENNTGRIDRNFDKIVEWGQELEKMRRGDEGFMRRIFRVVTGGKQFERPPEPEVMLRDLLGLKKGPSALSIYRQVHDKALEACAAPEGGDYIMFHALSDEIRTMLLNLPWGIAGNGGSDPWYISKGHGWGDRILPGHVFGKKMPNGDAVPCIVAEVDGGRESGGGYGRGSRRIEPVFYADGRRLGFSGAVASLVPNERTSDGIFRGFKGVFDKKIKKEASFRDAINPPINWV